MPSLSAGEWVTIAVLCGAPILLVVLWFADVIRPGSFARAGVRQLGEHPWWVWLAAGVLVFLSGQFAALSVHAAMNVPSWIDLPLRAQCVMSASMALAGIAAGAALLRMLRAGAPQAGVRPRWADLAVGMWCFVLAYPIILATSSAAAMIYKLVSGHAPENLAHDGLKQIAAGGDDPWAWAMRGTVVLLVPVFEELIYRVGLQSSLLKLTGRPWAAIAGTSACFTFAHASVMPAHALAIIAALSLSMGLAYERTKRLGVPIVMHAMFNGVNVLMAMWA